MSGKTVEFTINIGGNAVSGVAKLTEKVDALESIAGKAVSTMQKIGNVGMRLAAENIGYVKLNETQRLLISDIRKIILPVSKKVVSLHFEIARLIKGGNPLREWRFLFFMAIFSLCKPNSYHLFPLLSFVCGSLQLKTLVMSG